MHEQRKRQLWADTMTIELNKELRQLINEERGKNSKINKELSFNKSDLLNVLIQIIEINIKAITKIKSAFFDKNRSCDIIIYAVQRNEMNQDSIEYHFNKAVDLNSPGLNNLTWKSTSKIS